MSKYEEAEVVGRQKVVDAMGMYYPTFKYEYTEPQCHWDISVTGSTKEMIWECKDRYFPSTAYKDEGWMLNCNKAQWLKEESKKQNKDAYYVNTFQDNKIVLWNITKLPKDYPITYKRAWAHTVEKDKKIMKDYYMLNIKDAEMVIDIDELKYQYEESLKEESKRIYDLYGIQITEYNYENE